IAFALVEQLAGSPFPRSLPSPPAHRAMGLSSLPPATAAQPLPMRLRVTLDERYIVRALLPQLLERHFGPAAQRHYDVLIQSTKAHDTVLRWGTARVGSWERSLGFFTIRRDCLLGQTNPTHLTADDQATQNTVALLHQPGRCIDKPNPAAGI